MARVRIKTPEGKIGTIDEEYLNEAVKDGAQLLDSPKVQGVSLDDVPDVTSGVLGTLDGATGGFLDEAGAVVDTAGDWLKGKLGGANPKVADVLAAYKAHRGDNRELLDASVEQDPGLFRGGQVAGALALPVGKVGLAKGLPSAMAKGAEVGALFGAGGSNADLLEGDTKGLGLDMLRGAGIGAASGAVGYGAGKEVQTLRPQFHAARMNAENNLALGLQKLSQGAGDKVAENVLGPAVGGAVGLSHGGPIGGYIGSSIGREAQQSIGKPLATGIRKGADKLLGPLSRDIAKNKLRDGSFGMLTAENPMAGASAPGGNPALAQDLAAAGQKFEPIQGKYGPNMENGFMVENPDPAALQGLAQKYGQESVALTNKGANAMLNTGGPNAGTFNPGQGFQIFKQPPESNFSQMQIAGKQVPFSLNMDFGKSMQAPDFGLNRQIGKVAEGMPDVAASGSFVGGDSTMPKPAVTGVKGQLLQSFGRQIREKMGNGMTADVAQDASVGLEWIAQNVSNPYYARQAMQGVVDEPTLTRKIIGGLAVGLGVTSPWPEDMNQPPTPPPYDEPQQDEQQQPGFGGYRPPSY